MFEFVQQYFTHLKDENVFDPDVIWERIKSVIVKSLLAANKRTSRMQREQTTPNTIYEIYGYDIVLDNNYMPYLCEINETPNMGLEVNYHPDYHGLGAKMENLDAVSRNMPLDSKFIIQLLTLPLAFNAGLQKETDERYACHCRRRTSIFFTRESKPRGLHRKPIERFLV